MNTKEITNILHGSTPVSAVYQGEHLVWKQNPAINWLYKPYNLASLYDKDNFVDNTPWADKITDSTINFNRMVKSRCFSANIPFGVRFESGTYTIPLKTDTGLSSAYIRFRIASATNNPATFLKTYTSSYYGFSFYYEKGKIYLCKHSGSSTPYERIPLSVDSHFYNTYGFICDGNVLKLYVNGNYVDETAINGLYSGFVFITNADSNVTTGTEIIAMYNTLHNASEVPLATKPISLRYPMVVIDPSQGLMLYDHGNTCDENTGGWLTNPYSQYPNTICEFAEDCIKLNGVNGTTNYIVAVQTKNHFDFSKYSYIYFLVSPSVHPGNVTYQQQYMGTRCGYTSSSSPTITSGRVSTSYNIGGLCGKDSGEEKDAFLVFLNISKVTSSNAVFVGDASGLTNGKSAKIYSIWLV